MARFTPNIPFSVPMILLIPTETNVRGVPTKVFPALKDGIRINGNFRSFGGTEQLVNNLWSIEDTATVETWYRPDIASGCRIVIAGTWKEYEIISEPENVELRNQFLLFKVQRVKGGV